MSVETFVMRGEHILVGFLKAFFSQADLFTTLPNEFLYVDNLEENSLVVDIAGDFNHETVDALPAIILQEHGFDEQNRIIDHRKMHDLQNFERHTTNYVQQYTLHCLTRFRGTCKVLQSAVSGGIMMFRKAIYQMGVDHIFPLRGRPPQNLTTPDDEPNTHDAAVTLRMKMRTDWELDRYDDPEEQVKVDFQAAFDKIDRDSDGNITTPVSEYISDAYDVDQT